LFGEFFVPFVLLWQKKLGALGALVAKKKNHKAHKGSKGIKEE